MDDYKYEFDDTTVGNAVYSRADYSVIQSAYLLLHAKVKAWNSIALQHGATASPYAREEEDLAHRIEWGEEQLDDKQKLAIRVAGMTVGSLRYQKAALIHAAWHEEEKVNDAAKEGWPSAVVQAVRGRVRLFHALAQKVEQAPADILEQLRPDSGRLETEAVEDLWDAFISHASEDKGFAKPLAEALQRKGLRIWYDEFSLNVGDSLRRSIDRGLARSQYGVVILSRSFFEKEWPQRELDGLVAREIRGKKVLLPVWHDVSFDEVAKASPTLADRLGISTAKGIDAVVEALVKAIGK
ncbi:hypothetical protein GmRootV118_28500 [Variovorax sp. V118]|uniref:toll/interleukin-1 receptor domain-containing protein n=1 Tax=Variovorax sp. V118 TaxID=3065954 RepID=UPI0034E84A9A